MDLLRPGRRLGGGLLTLALLVVACGSAAGPSTPSSSSAPPESPVASPPDGATSPDPGAPDPGAPGGANVVPKPGQLDVHPVGADLFTATVDGSTVTVTASWTSGVEPCNVLDSVVVDRGEGVFTITLREGHGPEDIVCIAIAEMHRTTFDIPDVPAGTWTIRDSQGLAPDLEVVVD